MSKLLYSQDMDGLRCAIPGCTHQHDGPVFLHGKCHIGVGTRVSYQHGILTVRCRKCEALIAQVAVAGRKEATS